MRALALLVVLCALAAAASARQCTVRVCAGSSCSGRCVGAFEPSSAFASQVAARAADGYTDVGIEEVFCMNMCKRGPNVRLLVDGEVATVAGAMGETELKRRAFQGVRDDDALQRVWALAEAVAAGEAAAETHGPPPADMM